MEEEPQQAAAIQPAAPSRLEEAAAWLSIAGLIIVGLALIATNIWARTDQQSLGCTAAIVIFAVAAATFSVCWGRLEMQRLGGKMSLKSPPWLMAGLNAALIVVLMLLQVAAPFMYT
ncbi:MAG TPA: hypothetical protein VLF91_02595 [Candidatus Saccharimonadales bacterium]|nr:hypothetical protein [Candidatus Saccharimonadales bacterium]